MTVNIRPPVTIEQFQAFVALPENTDKRYEWIDGEIIEVPSNPFVSVIAGIILYAIRHWIIEGGYRGYVTGEGGGYIIDGQVVAPDVAYVRDLPTNQGYEATPPLLAVEVISDPYNNTEQTDLRRKLAYYMRAGVVLWVVDYVAQQVEVHEPGAQVRVLNAEDTLDGGDILPGFALPVKDIFPPPPTA